MHFMFIMIIEIYQISTAYNLNLRQKEHIIFSNDRLFFGHILSKVKFKSKVKSNESYSKLDITREYSTLLKI